MRGISSIIENPGVAKEMGDKGRIMVRKKYNWDIEKQALFQLYEDLSCKKTH
jgi:glycosyltransferase involved in cell wall biosynthesis